MRNTEIIKEVSRREVLEGSNNIKIEGVAIYNFVRRPLYERYYMQYGEPSCYRAPQTSKWEKRKSICLSFFQIFYLLFRGKRFDYFVFPFLRMDKINGEFVDKFTDPLIDYSCIRDSYIIFEAGNNGRHLKPRRHNNKVVYCDVIQYISKCFAKYGYKRYLDRNVDVFLKLFQAIENIFPGIDYDKEYIEKKVYCRIIEIRIYKFIFKRLRTKAFFAPSRNDFLHIIPAAKQLSIPVFELQHGFVKNESTTYSGPKDSMFCPDYFLAYGNCSVTDKYGIDIDKIRVIGWAFENYLDEQRISVQKKRNCDVLMISDPIDTEKLVDACVLLAKNRQEINFYYRAHPGEVLDDEYKKRLTKEKNVFLDDNSQNILVVLKQFQHVIGVNSTVLNEAVTYGKKVGILYIEGLCPFNVDGSEDEYFWKIDSLDAFDRFISASPSEKKRRLIYSKFNVELFEKVINV